MTWHLFLDESGDLGFNLDLNRCSRHFTICVLAVPHPDAANAMRRAVKKTLKRKVNRRKKTAQRELKGSKTSLEVKQYYYDLVAEVEFGIYALTLDKRSIREDLCSTPEKKDRLYDRIARQVVDQVPIEPVSNSVHLIVDRSKGKYGVARFNQSVIHRLGNRIESPTRPRITHSQSHIDLGLSAADLFCWGIFRCHEHGDDAWRNVFREKIRLNDSCA